MTRARRAAKGLVTPPPLQHWLNAVLLLCVSLVQGVAMTLGMIFNRIHRDWHTTDAYAGLPQAKSGIQLQEPTHTHGVIPGPVPGISAGPSRGLSNDPLETDNQDSRDALRLPGNDTALSAAATRTKAIPPPNGGGAPRTSAATLAIWWGTALTRRTVSGCGQTVPHLTGALDVHLARGSSPARGRTTSAPA